ncbi:Calreticulin-3 [Camellia lanceoleosa]|uniref:Calreticulin-3 n=1 Tax=Camellia lanceoleosa TaxID=1840588 RepID=A0ACC0HCY5_9ERIC|nr:Calreticulin-3 [Camellia lanceoleosa]
MVIPAAKVTVAISIATIKLVSFDLEMFAVSNFKFVVLQKIKNPNYKGKWKTPWIDNPEFEDDPHLYVLKPIKYVGIEVWQIEKDVFEEAEKARRAKEEERLLSLSQSLKNVLQELLDDSVQKSVRDDQNLVLLPKQLWSARVEREDGQSCCGVGWLLDRGQAITSKCIFSPILRKQSWKGNAERHLPGWDDGFNFHATAGASSSGRRGWASGSSWPLPI